MSSQDVYLHGTDPAEQDRLELMNRLLNDACLPLLQLEGGERVLEMGAGTGAFAARLVRAVAPDGAVLAIERDPRQLDALARRAATEPALEARAGDALDPPLSDTEWGSFDLAHARFLLEHLVDPAAAVAVLARAVRPGGRVALVDDDHSLMRLWPNPGGMDELWRVYYEQYDRLGNDPLIGRRLVELLVAAGREPTRATQIDYGACAGEPAFTGIVDNLARVVATGREAVLASTDWTAACFDGALERFEAWGRRPDAVVWYALPCAVGRRPERSAVDS